MDISDKLLLLLRINPTGSKLGISRDELCLQLGRNWDDIKEAVGILRSFAWVNCAPRYTLEGLGENEVEYWLTAAGCTEIDRRIKQAIAVSEMGKKPITTKELQRTAVNKLYDNFYKNTNRTKEDRDELRKKLDDMYNNKGESSSNK